MTDPLFRRDPYLREAAGRVTEVTESGAVVLDQSIFYPTSGGQPGDSGTLEWDGGRLDIATAVKGDAGAILLIGVAGGPLPPVGTAVRQAIDWPRRLLHMRVHTALHLLSVAVPFPVTGGQISDGKGRLDFDITGAVPPAEDIAARVNELIARHLPVSDTWISEEELDANPGLVKTLSVQPPRGQGRIRLVRIGEAGDQVDLQPCGGTHVTNTAEIGPIAIGKIENKGRQNRRITLLLAERPAG